MYCDEEIINVYLGQPKYQDKGNCFFDCFCDMMLHITQSYRLILECENYYISIQADGIVKSEKDGDISSIEKDSECIESYYHIFEDEPEEAPIVEYEFTLFTGEKIIAINALEKGYSIQFTDFTLKVIPYKEEEKFPYFIPASYSKVLGAERLIRKCTCGGNGVLAIDNVSDYCIRCDKCHLGTGSSMCAIDVIEEWNNAVGLFQMDDYPVESFNKCCFGTIEYIAIRARYQLFDDNTLECESVIAKIDGKLFKIGSCYVGQGNYDFSFEKLSNYNPEMWPRKIVSSKTNPIRFIRKETELNQFPVLRFAIGERPLLITADNIGLTVGLSHWDCDGNWLEYENNRLLNDDLEN